MNIYKRDYARGTWVESTLPLGLFIRARAICPDGKARIVRLAQCADSYFSIPARVSYRGHSVSGFVSFDSFDGLSTSEGQWPRFFPIGKYATSFGPDVADLAAAYGLRRDTHPLIVADKVEEDGEPDIAAIVREHQKKGKAR